MFAKTTNHSLTNESSEIHQQLSFLHQYYYYSDILSFGINCVLIVIIILSLSVRKICKRSRLMRKNVTFDESFNCKLPYPNNKRIIHASNTMSSFSLQFAITLLILLHLTVICELILIYWIKDFHGKFLYSDFFTFSTFVISDIFIIVFMKTSLSNAKCLSLILIIYWVLSLCWSIIKLSLIKIIVNNSFISFLRIYVLSFTALIYLILTFVSIVSAVKSLRSNFVESPQSSKKTKVPLTNSFKWNSTKSHSLASDYGASFRYRRNYSSLISKATFAWLFPLLRLGYSRPIELSDLGNLPKADTAQYQFLRFYRCFHKLKINSANITALSLWRCYWMTFRWTLAYGSIIKILADLFGFAGPLSINLILSYVNESVINQNDDDQRSDDQMDIQMITYDQFFSNGYILSLIILISTFLQSIFSNNFNHIVITEGMHLRSAIQCLLYEKSLRMTVTSGMDIGAIVNYMSNDSYNLLMFFSMGHYLWAVPFKIFLLLLLLYWHLGVSSLIGAATIYVLAPLQYYISTRLSHIQKKEMTIADERLRKTSELLMGIKLLKLLGWEMKFTDAINKIRERELKIFKSEAIHVALNTFLTQASSILVTLVTFALYPIIEGQNLSSAKVFTGLALFTQLTVPLYIIPVVIPILISAIVSTKRLAQFLGTDEVEFSVPWRKDDQNMVNGQRNIKREKNGNVYTQVNENGLHQSNDNHYKKNNKNSSKFKDNENTSNDTESSPLSDVLTINNGFFSWKHLKDNDNETSPILKGINISIPSEKLTIICGPIGSGKSSLINAMLGEMCLTSGDTQWSSQTENFIGFVPQSPWLMNTTLKENILMGLPYDYERYTDVLTACALHEDCEILPEGDSTEIGERGINLSGGQKQRIALARAIYSLAPNVFLDDPLSALDAHVTQYVFNYAIKECLLRHHRTVVLVTNNAELFCDASKIIVFNNDGTVRHNNTMKNIELVDPQLSQLWHHKKSKEEEARRTCSAEDSSVARERNKLNRVFSKQSFYRGVSMIDKTNNRPQILHRRRHVSFNRQISHDPVTPLPFHDFPDEESHDVNSIDPFCQKRRHRKKRISLSRMTSVDTENSESNTERAYYPRIESPSASMLSSEAGSSTSGYLCPKPLLLRLNSRNSRISNTETSIKEEIEDEDADNGSNCEDNEFPINYKLSRTVTIADNKELYEPSSHEISIISDSIDSDNGTSIDGKLIDGEDRAVGSVSKKVYLTYITACSIPLSIFVLILIVSTHAIKVATDFWLAEWAQSAENQFAENRFAENQLNNTIHSNNSGINSNLTESKHNFRYYVSIYALFSIITIILALITNLASQLTSLRAIRVLHSRMLSQIVQCPMRFFEITPIGRILNRFSSDMNTIDKKLPITLPLLLRFLLLCISAIVVDMIVTPFFIIIILPIIVVYYFLQHFFRFSSRELQRLDSLTKSPIFAHFQQTISGLTTIRAFRKESTFRAKCYSAIDANNLCFLMVNSANSWLGIVLDCLGGVILFSATIAAVTAAIHGQVSVSFVGMCMAYTLLVPIYLNWLLRNLASAEMYMGAVERVDAYSRLETEKDNQLSEIKSVGADWPSEGKIVFSDITLRYDLQSVDIISSFSLTIEPHQKVGICGRTGCGKSSLLNSLFRMINIVEGNVCIDGRDITTVDIHILRSRLSVIPQDVILFSGTIRDNLDPGNLHTDDEIWSILTLVKLTSKIANLNETVLEEGANFSVGQRQLLCLARALLRQTPILIMDEATSSLDNETEMILQEIIMKTPRTVISIAHRITNIINYDVIVVIDGGRIVEMGSPNELINNKKSIFSALLKAQKMENNQQLKTYN